MDDRKVARVSVWFNRRLMPNCPALLSRHEIDQVQLTVERRVRVCRSCGGDQVRLAESWRDPLHKSGPCPDCDGVGKDRFLVRIVSLHDQTVTWYGNDESLMRRIAADNGESLPNGEIAHQKLHGLRVPPPPVPTPDYS